MLCGGVMLIGHRFLVEPAEMVDAQLVDVGVVGGVLTGEILAEVGAVGAQCLRQLVDVQVALQVELLVDAVLLQQKFNVDKTLPRQALPRQALPRQTWGEATQRLHTPQQDAHHHDAAHLGDVFVGHATVTAHVVAEHQHYHDQHNETLPHLLVLQVGIVVAQPSPVAPYLAHHIDGNTDAQRQEIEAQPRHERIATCDDAHQRAYHQRRDHHADGPYRPPPVLQHAEHDGDGQWDDHQTVEQAADEHTQHHLVARREYDCRQVPQVSQCQGAEEHRRPPPQSARRPDARRKGIAPPQQKIDAGRCRHRCSCGVEHQQHDDIK